MSTKLIPRPTSTVVCDLCGKPLDTYTNDDRCSLKYGWSPTQRSPRPRWYVFEWSWWTRKRRGASEIKDDLYAADTSVDWDFHGECLVRTLRPIIAERLSVSAGSES